MGPGLREGTVSGASAQAEICLITSIDERRKQVLTGQELASGPSRQGPGGRRGDRGLPATLTPLELTSRARSRPQLSTNQEGPLSTRGSIPGVGKNKILGEWSGVPGNHQELLPVSLWPESPGLQRQDQARNPGGVARQSCLPGRGAHSCAETVIKHFLT